MKKRTGDRLLLDQQARTDFHFATNTKRIDALIANGSAGARANDLPVIIFRAAVDSLNGLALRRKAEEIKTPIGIDVRNVEEGVGKLNVFSRECAVLIA